MTHRAVRSRLEVLGLSALALTGLVAFTLVVATMTRADGPKDPPLATSATIDPDRAVFTLVDHGELPLEAGCDQLAYHAQLAMWNSALADDLLDFGCAFPILTDAASPVSAPTADPAMDLSADFAPLRYQDLIGALQRAGFEVCTEVRIVEPPGGGFVYGFIFHLRQVSCVSDAAEIEVVVREYATSAHRDVAARRMAERDADLMPLALGRWVISFEDLDRSGAADLSMARTAVLDLGGVPG